MESKLNHTIYVNNLNDKVNKMELRRSLYGVFSQFGRVLKIVAMKTMKMRGQAFIVFDEATDATKALRAMQGFPFFEKPMRIAYAKKEADVITERKGAQQSEKKRDRRLNRKPPSETFGSDVVNRVLFITNLPDEANEIMISMLFTQFQGYREVRMVPGHPNIAFVEFDVEQNAALAKEALQGFRITPTHPMFIKFAKK